MINFKELTDSLDCVIQNEKPSDYFYSKIWAVLVKLSVDDRKQLAYKLQGYSKNSKIEEGRYNLFIGMGFVFEGKYEAGINVLKEAYQVFSDLNDNGGLMSSSCLLSISYRSIGRLDLSQHFIQEALKTQTEVGENNSYYYFKCVSFYQAGELCTMLKKYDSAIGYFTEGMNYIGDNPEFDGRLLSGIGNTLMFTEKWTEAITHFEKGLEVVKNSNNLLLLSKIYSDIGAYYIKEKKYEKALENEKLGLEIRIKNNYVNPLITSYIHLAEIYFGLQDVELAIEYGEKAISEATRLKVNIKLYEAYEILSRIYESKGDIEKSYFCFKKYHHYMQEVINQESMRKIEQIQTQHQMEKMAQEKEIVHLRNVELKSALDEIKESVRYAKRIQNAILPSEKIIKKLLPNSFVFYQPKDIVAGDFYWMEAFAEATASEGIENKHILFAACDCTGHGVPGAMVSVVCHNSLNRAVREFKLNNPSAILDKTRELVIETFNSFSDNNQNEDEVKDGMDIALCSINGNQLKFSGANNPLWLIRNGELIELKGSKQPVGVYIKNEKFHEYNLALKENDCIYLFSDGLADQFGGELGKKFTYKKLRELLIDIHTLPMSQQQSTLEKTFNNWKGNIEQVDDILIIGYRFNK